MTCEFFRNEFLPYLTAFSFPLSPRLPVSQQEISFIYKNRNPKLTFAGSHIPPSSLTSLPSQTHSPPEESSVTTAVSLDSRTHKVSRWGNGGLERSATGPRKHTACRSWGFRAAVFSTLSPCFLFWWQPQCPFP